MVESKPSVAIVGASSDSAKFGNKAVRAYLRQGYDVYPINPSGGEIEGLPVVSSLSDLSVDHVDRISIYVPAAVGLKLLSEIQATSHDEFWINPGAESAELLARAEEMGLNYHFGCSIIDIGERP